MSLFDTYNEKVNLWEETIGVLEAHGKTWSDVDFVCLSDACILKDNFRDVASKTNYDDGYGLPYVYDDLMVVGKDFWLERHEYDGSEWWEYKTMPRKPIGFHYVSTLIEDYNY